ncbi:MAG: N-acetylmuramoyl-L-alanine amidase [Desulfitobacteriaceae bacterium]
MQIGNWKHGRRWNLLILSSFLVVLLSIALVWKLSHKDQKIWSWTMGSKVVVIDAGHGGVDPGAVSKNRVLEKDITLAVSKLLKNFIQLSGGKAIMVREDDRDLGTAEGLLKRKREDLAQRLQLALDSQADVYLSIHANSFPNENLNGPQVFFHSDSPDSKVLAQSIQQTLNQMVNGKRVAKGNKEFFILKKARQASVTIEVGFLSNQAEEGLLKDPQYQQKLAWSIYQGLCEYFDKVQDKSAK